jgi:hypothetical protein
MVNIEAGEIQVAGGRQKTGETQNAPLLPEARAIIAEQLNDQKRNKVRQAVRAEDRLVFSRPEDSSQPLSKAMLQHHHSVVCRAAGCRISGSRILGTAPRPLG